MYNVLTPSPLTMLICMLWHCFSWENNIVMGEGVEISLVRKYYFHDCTSEGFLSLGGAWTRNYDYMRVALSTELSRHCAITYYKFSVNHVTVWEFEPTSIGSRVQPARRSPFICNLGCNICMLEIYIKYSVVRTHDNEVIMETEKNTFRLMYFQ